MGRKPIARRWSLFFATTMSRASPDRLFKMEEIFASELLNT